MGVKTSIVRLEGNKMNYLILLITLIAGLTQPAINGNYIRDFGSTFEWTDAIADEDENLVTEYGAVPAINPAGYSPAVKDVKVKAV